MLNIPYIFGKLYKLNLGQRRGFFIENTLQYVERFTAIDRLGAINSFSGRQSGKTHDYRLRGRAEELFNR